ncbi:hypothetical protein BKA25_004017 [Actinoalloteichus hymeniacidonis]|uniref:Uncharacterized protein n=1 Tax=Actinoalloteichus hymeniacidonis TaxID=340345 RepID=A0AAC9HN02_9PSEU|nr:hypothetical protein TL08_07275 [Actinoalloteichus hymeniacidonis]MBB5909701.1 hypothetical protein [Actinoalloteichus hymeniacidonis]
MTVSAALRSAPAPFLETECGDGVDLPGGRLCSVSGVGMAS